MHDDSDFYDARNLKESDRAQLDVMEGIKQDVLNNEVVTDFIDSKEVSGGTLRGIYKDVLTDFIAFLQERVEYRKVDFIVEKIDGYTDEEFKQLYHAARLGASPVDTDRKGDK